MNNKKKKTLNNILSLIFAVVNDNKCTGTIKLQLENDKFKFYSFNKDEKCIDDLDQILSENYNRITKKLNIILRSKIEVEIYPDIKAYHYAIKKPNAPNWLVGTGWENKIKMVSPLNPGKHHTYDSLMQVIVHEFTHVVISNINSDLTALPIWLNEGIATYEAKQMTSSLRGNIKKKIHNDQIPSLEAMNSEKFSKVGGYAFSYAIVEYLIKEYGYNIVVSLIKEPHNIEEILGINIMELEDNWRHYLKESNKLI